MRNKETSSVVESQQAFAGMMTDLLLTAERELASFYGAIERMYGSEEARRAAHDWIDEVESMDSPVNGVLPNWRRATIVAADCLASRVVQRR
jgi:hypothetical protein